MDAPTAMNTVTVSWIAAPVAHESATPPGDDAFGQPVVMTRLAGHRAHRPTKRRRPLRVTAALATLIGSAAIAGTYAFARNQGTGETTARAPARPARRTRRGGRTEHVARGVPVPGPASEPSPAHTADSREQPGAHNAFGGPLRADRGHAHHHGRAAGRRTAFRESEHHPARPRVADGPLREADAAPATTRGPRSSICNGASRSWGCGPSPCEDGTTGTSTTRRSGSRRSTASVATRRGSTARPLGSGWSP